MPVERNGNVVYLSQATIYLSGKNQIPLPTITTDSADEISVTMTTTADENENLSFDSSESSDSDLASECEELSSITQCQTLPMPKRTNKYHPLNWYTPTVLSPILDVSPSLESREAERSTSTTSKTMSNVSDDEDSEVQVSIGRDAETQCNKLKRSPAIIDFSDPGKMSRSTGDLPEVNEEVVVIEDSSTDQSLSLMTKSESAMDPAEDSEVQTSASSTNLLFDEISVPFYFTLPAEIYRSKQESASMDDSLHRPKYKQSRLTLVMSQVLLKEELKEALCLQRSKLTECEIEADERAAKVEKKLSEQAGRARKGSFGSRKVHAVPDKHIFDGRWCSEPSLVNEKLSLPMQSQNQSPKLSTVAVQTDPLLDLSQLGRNLPPSNATKSEVKSCNKEIKRVKSGRSKRKSTVAINTQITWRALQVPTSGSKNNDRSRSPGGNIQGFSGIAYNDLLDFSNPRRCAYCNNGGNPEEKTASNVSRDVLYEYFLSKNPRRVTLFNDYGTKSILKNRGSVAKEIRNDIRVRNNQQTYPSDSYSYCSPAPKRRPSSKEHKLR